MARQKVDGSLYLLCGQTKKVVFFEGGQPVFVRSNVLSECLGQILAQEGLITQEQCEQTLEAIRRTGKKQGELLVEMGILSEGNLRYGLEAQLRAKLFDIFSWEEGRYQFKGDTPDLQFGITLKSSAEGVIVEAIQDQYTEDRAGEALDAVAGKYPVLNDEAAADAELALLPEERHYLACIDGSRSVRQLLDETPEPPIPTPRALLCGLLLAGLITLADEAAPKSEWPEAPDLQPTGGTDEELRPNFDAQALITEYEDTPLPGEMPRSPDPLGDHEDDFEGVGEDSGIVRASALIRTADVSEDLVAAEPDSIEETFDDDQIELSDDADGLGAAPPLLNEDRTPPPMHEFEATFDEIPATDPTTEFDPDVPTAVEPPLPPVGGPAVPDQVAPSSTMPTPTDELPSDPSQPGAPVPPPPIESMGESTVGAPPTVGAKTEAVSFNDDDGSGLLDLAPDDDLLMADEAGDPGTQTDLLESSSPISIDPESLDEDAIDEDALVEMSPEELELDEIESSAPSEAPPARADDLLDFADLDDIDLGADDAAPAATAEQGPPLDLSDDDINGDMLGALRFNEGQAAVADQRFAEAVGLLEQAYQAGFDVAELHAMLAYARFEASGQDEHTAIHAFELLDYAQQMDPSLDLVHAYRGAIHRAQGDIPQAREALDRALELNPYCELAMAIMDSIS